MTLGEVKPDWPISELKQLDGGGLPMGLLPAPPTTLTLRAQALEVLPHSSTKAEPEAGRWEGGRRSGPY